MTQSQFSLVAHLDNTAHVPLTSLQVLGDLVPDVRILVPINAHWPYWVASLLSHFR